MAVKNIERNVYGQIIPDQATLKSDLLKWVGEMRIYSSKSSPEASSAVRKATDKIGIPFRGIPCFNLSQTTV